MTNQSKFTFEVKGKYALFSDPITKMGGEKCSYPIPTYSAIRGILDSVFWKPTFFWVVDEVKVMNKIEFFSKCIKTLLYRPEKYKTNDLSFYTYLVNPIYHVTAHYEWNMNKPELTKDRNHPKYNDMIQRWIDRGGSKPICLGTTECPGIVTDIETTTSYYDSIESVPFGIMFHGFDYPWDIGKEECWARFHRLEMINGVIKYPHPTKCTMRKFVKPMAFGDKR